MVAEVTAMTVGAFRTWSDSQDELASSWPSSHETSRTVRPTGRAGAVGSGTSSGPVTSR